MWAYPRLRTWKRAKVAATYYTYLAIRGQISHTPSVEFKVDWTTHKTLPFCFSPISVTSYLHKKDTRFSLRYISTFQESLGTRLQYTCNVAMLNSNAILMAASFPGLPRFLFFSSCQQFVLDDQCGPLPLYMYVYLMSIWRHSHDKRSHLLHLPLSCIINTERSFMIKCQNIEWASIFHWTCKVHCLWALSCETIVTLNAV